MKYAAKKLQRKVKYLLKDLLESNAAEIKSNYEKRTGKKIDLKKIREKFLIPLVQVMRYLRDLDTLATRKDITLKANHTSGWNILIQESEEVDLYCV